MKNYLVLILCLAISISIKGQTHPTESDKFKQWAADFIKGNHIRILESVEKDLSGENPHPYAYFVWVRTADALNITESRLEILDPKISSKLSVYNEIKNFDEYEQYSTLARKFSELNIGSDPFLFGMYFRAFEIANEDKSIQLLKDAFNDQPLSFSPLWQASNSSDNIKTFRFLSDQTLSGNYSSQSQWNLFLQHIFKYKPLNSYDRIIAVDKYLTIIPNDEFAFRYKAAYLDDIEKFEEAVKNYQKSFEINPFYSTNNLPSIAESLLKLHQYKDAEKAIKLHSKLFHPTDSVQFYYSLWASALINTGNLGEARKILEKGLSQFPQSAEINYQMGVLESNSNRISSSIPYLRTAYSKNPKNNTYINTLLENLLSDNKVPEAIDLLPEIRRERNELSQEIYTQYSEIYSKLEMYDEAIELLDEAISIYPASAWMHRQKSLILGNANRTDKSIAAIQLAHSIAPPTRWSVNHLTSQLDKKHSGNKELLKQEIEKLITDYPYLEVLWEKLENFEPTTQGKINVWQNAKKINPCMAFPLANLRYYLSNQEKWSEMESVIAESEPIILECASKNDFLEFLWNKGVSKVLKLRRTRLTQDEVDAAIVDFNNYLAEGGRDAAFHEYISEVYESIGNSDSAKWHLLKAVEFRPDNHNLNWKLWTKYGERQSTFRYIDRNPYDGNRLKSFIHLNAMWSGSPILAISYSQRIKEIDPDKYNSYHEAMAYGQLGDNAQNFEVRYSRARNISVSQRYIDWYNTSRYNAWKGSAKVEIDQQNFMATIIYPDGTIAKRQDDPRNGKIKKLQSGVAFVEADYNDRGDIKRISTSSGSSVELKYNVENQIAEIITSQGGRIRIEYNEMKKPITLEAKDLGKIVITYDSEGEIELVESFDTNGEKGSYSLTVEIQGSINQLTSLARILEKSYDLSKGSLPNLGIENVEYQKLRGDYDSAYERFELSPNSKAEADLITYGLNLSRYMISNMFADADYGNQSLDLLMEIFRQIEKSSDLKMKQQGFEAIKLYYDALQKVRTRGVNSLQWQCWIDMQEWVQLQILTVKKPATLVKEMVVFQKSIYDNPVVLLQSSEWLPKSFLQIEGYWRNYNLKELLPQTLQNQAVINTILIRENGHLAVGTNKGICINRKGFWEWLGYDEIRNEWISSLPSTGVKASSNVLSIVELPDSSILVGTANGLFHLNNNYKGRPLKTYSESDGLTSKNISHLANLGTTIAIGTGNGLFYLRNGKIVADNLVKQSVRYLSNTIEDADYNVYSLIAGTDRELFRVEQIEGNVVSTKLLDATKDDAFIADNGDIFTLYGKNVTRLTDIKDPQLTGYKEIQVYGNVITTDVGKTFGFTQIPVNQFENAVGVMTDLGISLYHERSFEHFYLPLSPDRKAKVLGGSLKDNKFACYSDDGVWVFEKDRSLINSTPVSDLITLDSIGVTFIAGENGLSFIDHSKPEIIETYDYYSNITCFEKESETSFLAGNGKSLVRYSISGYDREISNEELFYADQYRPSSRNIYDAGNINGIVKDNDGTIWVSTRLSVFSYQENGTDEPEVIEYNFFRDEKTFPSRTDMIYGIYKTIDGKIRVVCSDESHRYYNGIALEGGLLEWDSSSKKFIRLKIKDDQGNTTIPWFVTSYTPTGKNKAIIGTISSEGFREEINGEAKTIANPSFKNLYQSNPSLFLGTKGVNIDNLWLFGCAAGVVAYYDGIWLYPNRINQLLPSDIEFANYGGRKVNAISADSKGKIYIGTDLGLLVYDIGGADVMSFLMNNFRQENAILYHNTQILEEERDILLKDIPEGSDAGKLIREIEQTEARLAQLEENKIELSKNSEEKKDKTAPKEAEETTNKLLVDLNRKHTDLLLQLEEKEPALFQSIRIPPLDLAAARKKLKEDECVVQYIPLSKKLYIQILSKEKMEMREVNIPNQQLLDSSLLLSQNLASYLGDRGGRMVQEENPDSIRNALLNNRLSYLYEILLRPIENTISGFGKIYIVPVKELNYLPFGALLNRVTQNRSKYAVEDFSIGYLSSMYLFDLIYNLKPSESESILLMGDPDRTLPHAEVEVNEVANFFDSKKLFVGSNASLKNFESNIRGNKIIHLATHGKLVAESLKDSWLLFANEQKFNMSGAFNLPLDGTELVVLSACESGLGGKGLEYSTLARAFANAGAQTIMATLWEVNDYAAKELMVRFYRHYTSGSDKFTALTKAQRELIQSDDKRLTHPSKWSPYIVIGKP